MSWVNAQLRWSAIGPAQLDETKRQQAIEMIKSKSRFLTPVSDDPTAYCDFDGMTSEEFVDWFYSYWKRQKRRGDSATGRRCFMPTDGYLDLLKLADDIGITGLLGVRLD